MSLNLNITKWKEFRIGDLFKITRWLRHIAENREPWNVRYFSASQENNWLTDMISNPLFVDRDALIYSTFWDCYFVWWEFTASDEISILKNENLTKYSWLFISTVISANRYKYAYWRKAFQNKFVNETIKLPADSSWNPDRKFMEDYIKWLRYRPITTKNKSWRNKLNIHERKEFRVWEVLKCSTTKLSIKDDLDVWEIPLISRTAMNNWCDWYFDIEKSKITKKWCITIWAEWIYAFYQPKDFWTWNKVYTLENDKLNKYSALFICTILNKEDYKYSYWRARILSKIVDEFIKLPVDGSWNPDREFMENYIKNLPYWDKI